MRLTDIGEFGFIDRIRRGCVVRPERVVKAIGDDCAAVMAHKEQVSLLTTDLLVERVHFIRDATTGFNLGYKALAVNLSDIAAMGGDPQEAFVSIAVPDDCSLDFLDDLYRGLRSLAGDFGVNILGGDTTGSKQDLVINIAVMGVVTEDQMLCRDGARPGDRICTTGCLGDSRAGLHLVLNRIEPDSDHLAALFKAHILPAPHVHEGRFLATCGAARAAIDVSDGLANDLSHIAKQSRVGARIYDQRIPISDSLAAFCRQKGFDPAELAVDGGEDYVLLVTLAADKADKIRGDFKHRFGRPLYDIGEIIPAGVIERVRPDGRISPLSPTGWDHFKASRQGKGQPSPQRDDPDRHNV